MDKRGSGVLRMGEAMKEWKLPEPTFEENKGYWFNRNAVRNNKKRLHALKQGIKRNSTNQANSLR